MTMYLKGGKGIKNPKDFNGNEIKKGDTLTGDYFDDFFNDEYYKKYFPKMSKEDIQNHKTRPLYKVKWNGKDFYYAEGINQNLYLHDFRFEYTKIIKSE